MPKGRKMSMAIGIDIPSKTEIFKRSIPVKTAVKGESWSASQLGEAAKSPGVYVLSFNKEILYVGLTSGKKGGRYGVFGARLRREFHYSASGNSALYQLLVSQQAPIDVSLFDFDEIDALITSDKPKLSPKAKAFIFEQALTAVFNPPGNKQQQYLSE